MVVDNVKLNDGNEVPASAQVVSLAARWLTEVIMHRCQSSRSVQGPSGRVRYVPQHLVSVQYSDVRMSRMSRTM